MTIFQKRNDIYLSQRKRKVFEVCLESKSEGQWQKDKVTINRGNGGVVCECHCEVGNNASFFALLPPFLHIPLFLFLIVNFTSKPQTLSLPTFRGRSQRQDPQGRQDRSPHSHQKEGHSLAFPFALCAISSLWQYACILIIEGFGTHELFPLRPFDPSTLLSSF